jgi:hypothetical protein
MPEHNAVEGGKEATMRAFTIDTEDNITAYGSTEELGERKAQFCNMCNSSASCCS